MLKSKYENIFVHQDTYWWYKGMQEIHESLLTSYLSKKRKKDIKILDAGCGPGAALIYLAKYGNVIGVDISDEALQYAKKRGKVKKGDLSSLPFADETFDIVTCFDVLYHKWVNRNKAFLEIKRVLKPGGIALVREPAFNWLHSSEDIASQTKHRFTAGEMKEAFGDSFDILKLTYVNFFLFPFAFLKRLPEVLRLKKKRGESDASNISPTINNMLFSIFSLEPFFLRFLNFPFGTSILCVVKKRKVTYN